MTTPDPVLPSTLQTPRTAALPLGLGSLGFVLAGLYFDMPIAVAFFGLGVILSLVTTLKPGRLALTNQGLRVTHLGFTWPLMRWQDVSGFEPSMSTIGFDYAGPSLGWRPGMAVGAKALTGHNAALPALYGKSAEDLTSLLRQARREALHQP